MNKPASPESEYQDPPTNPASERQSDDDPVTTTSTPSGEGEEVATEDRSAEELLELLNEANEQIAGMKDGYLRAKAEVENIRRRSQNEIVTARKYAIEGFAQELLSIRDSLDQASRVEIDEGSDEAVANMREGLTLTGKQFDSVMAKFSVTEVEAAPGVRFDPAVHQAISMVPSDEVEPEHIVAVMQRGFLLKDRLLRPAMVVVASNA